MELREALHQRVKAADNPSDILVSALLASEHAETLIDCIMCIWD
jgi:hypothetical protein